MHVPVSCERVYNLHQILKGAFGSKKVKNQGPRRIINVGLVQLAGGESGLYLGGSHCQVEEFKIDRGKSELLSVISSNSCSVTFWTLLFST